MLNNPSPTKDIPDLLSIAWHNNILKFNCGKSICLYNEWLISEVSNQYFEYRFSKFKLRNIFSQDHHF